MAQYNDTDAGIHKAARRLQLLSVDEIQIFNATIAPAAFAESAPLYAVAFENFCGQIEATTAFELPTTLSVRIVPRGNHVGGGLFSDDEFVVATLASTFIGGSQSYTFSWGVGRGVLTAPSGGTYIYSGVFKIRIHNTGANEATAVTITNLECVG